MFSFYNTAHRVTPIPPPPAPSYGRDLEYRVEKVARALLVGVVVVLGNLLTLGIPLGFRIVSALRKRARKQEIAATLVHHLHQACIIHLGKEKPRAPAWPGNSLSWVKPEDLPLPHGEKALCFAREVLSLREKISALNLRVYEKKTVSLDSIETVYKAFQTFVDSPAFREIYPKLEEGHPVKIFLQLVAVKFRTADMSVLLTTHAREKLQNLVKKQPENSYSLAELGATLADYQRQAAFRKKEKQEQFFWAITHPLHLYHSWNSERAPHHYHPCTENPTYSVQTLNIEGVATKILAGPTPYNDPVYKALVAPTIRELRFDIMDISVDHEKVMIGEMDRVAQQSAGHVAHILFGFTSKGDAASSPLFSLPFQKKKKTIPTLHDLVDEYQEKLCKRDSAEGVFIPPTHFSDAEIALACTEVKNLFKSKQLDLSQVEVQRAVLIAVDALIALGIVLKEVESRKGHSVEGQDPDLAALHLSAACKQCFDRGPIYVSALQLYLRSLTSEESLSEAEFYHLAGLSLFRAPLQEGRQQLADKASCFSTLMKLLETTQQLHEHTRSFCSALSRLRNASPR